MSVKRKRARDVERALLRMEKAPARGTRGNQHATNPSWQRLLRDGEKHLEQGAGPLSGRRPRSRRQIPRSEYPSIVKDVQFIQRRASSSRR